MPRVVVRLYATLREKAGGNGVFELELPGGSTVLDALREVDSRVPGLLDEVVDDSRVREGYKVLVNGRDVDFEGGLGRRLGEGDIIHVFPPVAGG